jgi:hypothetical protein
MNQQVVGKLIAWLAALAIGMPAMAVQADPALRPEVVKPLEFAQEHIKARRWREALLKVREAEAAPSKSVVESMLIERMRAAAAVGAADIELATRSFEGIDGSGQASLAEKLPLMEAIAALHYRAQNYAQAQQWYQRYFKAGGDNRVNRNLLIQSHYLSGDLGGAAKELKSDLQAAEKGTAAPSEEQIQWLMHIATQQKDAAAETFALERLVRYYPKKEYWAALLGRIQNKPEFSERLTLDAHRLALAAGCMHTTDDYFEMAQLALQAGFGFEAKQVVEQGLAAGALGVGAEAERHKRLLSLINKHLAEAQKTRISEEKIALTATDGNKLLAAGLNKVFEGQKAQGLVWIAQGVSRGKLAQPEDAKLHWAMAQIMAGDNTQAQSILKSVSGSDGTADLARLWFLHTQRSPISRP